MLGSHEEMSVWSFLCKKTAECRSAETLNKKTREFLKVEILFISFSDFEGFGIVYILQKNNMRILWEKPFHIYSGSRNILFLAACKLHNRVKS